MTDKSAANWSSIIRASVERTVASIVETGNILIACKAALPHGEYTKAVTGAGMSIEVAGMYTRVAKNKVLSNTNVHPSLPPSHHVLNELAKLDIADLEACVRYGTVRPTMSLGEAKATRKSFQRSPMNRPRPRRAVKHAWRGSAHTEVTDTEFTTVVIDPPWEESEYPNVSLDELRELIIPAADNAHLYLWLTRTFQ